MTAQIVVFSRKTDAQRKTNFAFRSEKIAQKFCAWKPYFEIFCGVAQGNSPSGLIFILFILIKFR